MKVAVFSTKPHDQTFLDAANVDGKHELVYLEEALNRHTARLAEDFEAVCAFVHDRIGSETVTRLAERNVKLIALRCAGFNNVDLKAAADHGIQVARVPAYSPHAVAEHAVAMILALNRKIYKAHTRVRDANFSLNGLLGFDLNGKTVGVIGTGKIGALFAQIMHGFGCKILAHDVKPNPECEALGFEYVKLERLFAESDIISLHCPLTKELHHLIDAAALKQMKDGVMLINTSRGKLIDTPAVNDALKSGKVGYLGLDVYEEEDTLFFEDRSDDILQDDVFARLITFPNVLVTAHQAFFTDTAIRKIAETTLANLDAFENGKELTNRVPYKG